MTNHFEFCTKCEHAKALCVCNAEKSCMSCECRCNRLMARRLELATECLARIASARDFAIQHQGVGGVYMDAGNKDDANITLWKMEKIDSEMP